MGRRAKRADPLIYLRQRIDNAKVGRKNGVTEWGMKVFFPLHGRAPNSEELCSAVDSGEIGLWIDSQYTNKEIVETVIVLNGRAVPKAEYVAYGKKKAASKDSTARLAEEAHAKERRERYWLKDSEDEAIQAAIAGTVKGCEAIEALAQKLYAAKVAEWKTAQYWAKQDTNISKKR